MVHTSHKLHWFKKNPPPPPPPPPPIPPTSPSPSPINSLQYLRNVVWRVFTPQPKLVELWHREADYMSLFDGPD